MPFRLSLLSVLLFFFCSLSFARNYQQFSSLSSEDGLSQNSAICILQDNEGFIWVGTRDGLNRYNGYEFLTFQSIENDFTSISNNRILSLVEDDRGRIWVGTANGLNIYDKSQQTFQRVNVSEKYGLTSNGIYALFKDSRQRIWIGTYGGGIAICDLNEGEKCRVLNTGISSLVLSDLYIRSIVETLNGNVWVATRSNGVLIFSGDGVFLEQISVEKQGYGLLSDAIRNLFVDQNGSVWIATERDGITCYHPQSRTFKCYTENTTPSISDNVVRTIAQDDDGGIWLGSLSGLDYIRTDKKEPIVSDNKVLAVQSILFDVSGNMWVGTYYDGITVFFGQEQGFAFFEPPFSNSETNNYGVVSAFAEDEKGNLWIGTEDKGIKYYDKMHNAISDFEIGDLVSLKVKALHYEKPSTLYIGTFGAGLYVVNTKSGRFIQYQKEGDCNNSLSSNYIYALEMGPDAQLWLATNYGGLCYFDTKNKTFETVYSQNVAGKVQDENSVFDIVKGPQGDLWIASQTLGLLRYDGQSFSQINLAAAKQISGRVNTRHLFFDSYNNLWVGTETGLYAYRLMDGSLKHYGREDGLAGNHICGILEDDKMNLWISGINGITRFPLSYHYDMDDCSDSLLSVLTSKDGLQGDEFNKGACLKMKDGSLLFGGVNGFNRFVPQSFVRGEHARKLSLERLFVLNEEILPSPQGGILTQRLSYTKHITLGPDQSSFSIDYLALDYNHAEQINYSYMLEGYDDEWVKATNVRRAIYTKVPPGNYRFLVKAVNTNGHWETNTAQLELKIMKPFWLTAWAFVVYVLFVMSSFYFLFQWRNERQRQQQLLNDEREKALRIKEMDDMKSEFFANVSHQFRTPLTLISGPIEQLRNDTALSDEDKDHLMSLVDRNVIRLHQLISQLMDYSRLENNMINVQVEEARIGLFISAIVDRFEDFLSQKGVDVDFVDLTDEHKSLWFDKRILENVISIILFNAAKYTPENGLIELKIEEENGEVKIAILNTGSTIPEEKQAKIFDRFYSEGKHDLLTEGGGTGIGLSFAKKLVELHKGHIGVKSKDDTTVFEVSLPVSKASYASEEQCPSATIDPDEAGTASNVFVDIQSEDINVLVVEDDPELRVFISSQFSSCKVFEASNGKEGFKLAKKVLPDIIISDVMMPEMDGVELCKKLKTHMATNHIPVILLTAKTAIDHRIEGMESGADLYMDKPFNIKVLKTNVHNLIEQRLRLKEHFAGANGQEEAHLYKGEDTLLLQAEDIIRKRLSDPTLSVEDLSKELSLSRSQLFRKFKALSSYSPNEFIKVIRLRHAADLLKNGALNVSEIAYDSGFSSPSLFINTFKKHYGATPKEYAKKS